MKRQTKFSSEEQQSLAEGRIKQTSIQEFSTAEELLRHDAKTVVVPAAIAQRLNQSIKTRPRSEGSWWQRLFGS